MDQKRLYIGNLSYKTTSDGLREAFSQAGQVVSADVMMDRQTGRPRGFGFVEMASDEDVKKAIDMWNGKELDERTLRVNVAQPKASRM
ncbi:MAG: RNA-binding protein [Candidatus Levybacteria bacterium]|nr:RNA-binding protein [Candidatus Levybacteria bacterium]